MNESRLLLTLTAAALLRWAPALVSVFLHPGLCLSVLLSSPQSHLQVRAVPSSHSLKRLKRFKLLLSHAPKTTPLRARAESELQH